MMGPARPADGKNGRWVLVGTSSVDSANIGISDPAFVHKPPAYDHHPGALIATEWGSGVAFLAGFGDGLYDIWGWVVDYGSEQYPDERVAAVVITFIDEVELADWNAM